MKSQSFEPWLRGKQPNISFFAFTATTGSITIESTLPEGYGVKIATDTTTGGISIPGGDKSYTSPDYETASVKYEFDLETTTGQIKYT